MSDKVVRSGSPSSNPGASKEVSSGHFKEGLLLKFGSAYSAASGTSKELDDLASNATLLEGILSVQRHASTIVPSDLVIDCDIEPFSPEGLEVDYHAGGGTLDLRTANIDVHRTDDQKTGWVHGLELLRRLSLVDNLLTANVLDFLWVNPHHISGTWDRWEVCFWGTIYKDRHNATYVRNLYNISGKLQTRPVLLSTAMFGFSQPAAIQLKGAV